MVNNDVYFAISVSSPIGRILLGKTTGDVFIFNNIQQTINDVF
ncbi:hypothetical protein [Tenacibaculum retecalamus]